MYFKILFVLLLFFINYNLFAKEDQTVSGDLIVTNGTITTTNITLKLGAISTNLNPAKMTLWDSAGVGKSFNGFELSVSSKNGWGGYMSGVGSSANNLLTVVGWSTVNATNEDISGWAFYSSSSDLQDKYAWADINLPSLATNFYQAGNVSETSIVIRVRTSSIDNTSNKVTIVFGDTLIYNAISVDNMTSITANAWNSYYITNGALPAHWKTNFNGIRPALKVRGNYFSCNSNYVQWAEIWTKWQ